MRVVPTRIRVAGDARRRRSSETATARSSCLPAEIRDASTRASQGALAAVATDLAVDVVVDQHGARAAPLDVAPTGTRPRSTPRGVVDRATDPPGSAPATVKLDAAAGRPRARVCERDDGEPIAGRRRPAAGARRCRRARPRSRSCACRARDRRRRTASRTPARTRRRRGSARPRRSPRIRWRPRPARQPPSAGASGRRDAGPAAREHDGQRRERQEEGSSWTRALTRRLPRGCGFMRVTARARSARRRSRA